MFKTIWQKVASPSCHSLRLRMDSSDLTFILIHGFVDPCDSAPKWHLDRFTGFCKAHGAQHLDAQSIITIHVHNCTYVAVGESADERERSVCVIVKFLVGNLCTS